MNYSVPTNIDLEHRRCIVGNEPMIFHCHHYNTFLQRSIQDATYVDSTPFLVGAGAEVAYGQLSTLFSQNGITDIARRKALAGEIYRWAGFGTFDLTNLNENGGTVSTTHSHYAISWQAKWKQATDPVCHFASGWLAGALAAIYDLPNGSHGVEHTVCSAVTGSGDCTFVLKAGSPNYTVYDTVGVGPLTTHNVRPIPENHVDYDGILGAVGGLPLVGNEDGMIPAFGVYLTRQYANYYNRISFEFLRNLVAQFGDEGWNVVTPLLVEAGHVCAFNTFGGIMLSTEWDALIRPNFQSSEDWVHGIVAVVNALGWGRWQVTKVSAEEAEFVIHDDYESIGHLAMFGTSRHPVSFLAEGAAAGIMNLVYVGNIAERPALTPGFYDRLFRRPGVYHAKSLTSQAMGDDVTSFRVTRG